MSGTSLAQYVGTPEKWPTPATRDHKGANGADHLENGTGRRHLDQLPNFVEHVWSTPRSSDGEKGGPNQSFRSGSGLPLPSQAHKWATPSVADTTGGRMNRSGARSGEMLLKGQAAIVSKQWPTPRSHEVGGYQYDHGNPKKPYLTLTGMACSRPAQINGTYGTSSRTVLLNYYLRIRATTSSELRSEMRALLRLAIRRRGRGWTRSAPAAYVRPSFRRSLNPRFVAWLMGWPPPASTGFGFSATAWSRWRQAMRSALLSLGLPPEDQPRQADLFA